MADQSFSIGMALDVQSAFGTPNATIAALAGTVNATDGAVLGDKASGDADSGISIPQIVPIVREVAAVAASFTESADSFQRATVEGFSIAFPLQGNNVDATPAAGEASIATAHKGIHAILYSAGLIAANGAAPAVEYTPRHAGSAGGPTIYSTVKLWIADLSFVFTDCLVDTFNIVCTPGGNAIMTANFKVGKHDPATGFADGVSFPTFGYGTQATLAAPVVAGVNFTWGVVRGFETMNIGCSNEIEEFGDSNVAVTGIRQAQTRRVFTVDGRLYLDSTDSDFEYQKTIGATAPTEDLSFQIGTAATTGFINAIKLEVNNLQSRGVKWDKIGTATIAELSSAKATSLTAGTEFKLSFN
jgi:hypothetical protein